MDFAHSIHCHYEKFPPKNLDYGKIVHSFLKASDALARYDQMLKNIHKGKILLAPLKNQETVISSRMERTISTIDTTRNVAKNNNWEAWCIFFLNAIEKQAIRNLEIAERIKGLYEEMKLVFSDTLSSKWSVNALDYIFTNPIFRNNRFTSKSGIPGPTAARFTRILLDKELLRTIEESSGRRPALYAFEPLLKIVRV